MPTETVLSQNTQEFNDDEIVDNFGAGPDDGVPMGLGGEKGKQAEPANSTLEADMLAPPAKPNQEEKSLPGDALPPDDAAAGGEPEPVQDTAGEDDKAPAESQQTEPDPSEFPDTLLRMAGFSTAEAATKAGFKDPDALLAAIQWRSQSLAAPTKPSRTSYLEADTPKSQPTTIPAETAKSPEGDGTFQPFKPANAELFDEDLLKLLEDQNRHYAAQLEQLKSQLQSREVNDSQRQRAEEAEQFDKTVRSLGKEWEAEFGKDSGDVLFGKSDVESVAAVQNRLDLFDAVKLLRQTNAEQGNKPMTLEQEVQWALMQRHPDKFRQQLLREREAKAQSRRSVQASRPTARKTPLGNKDERLLSTLQTKFPKVNWSEGDNEIGGDI